MKVGNINSVLFRGSNNITKPEPEKTLQPQIKELQNVTPDFAVSKPSSYQKNGEIKLVNGLIAHSYKLGNGYKVTIVPMEGSPTVVKNYVNVGSLNETDDIKGISHFLEHMAFNGTIGDNGYEKLNVGDSFSRIEKLGGWTNASTGYALTDYVNSTPMLEKKDLEEQIKIIAAMTENLALTDKMIEKEKGPVCSEINMILDNPQTIAIDQTVRTLFNINSSADELIGGSVDHIKNLTRDKVKAYYDKYYTPNNMNLVITGDVDPQETINLVAKHFKSNKIQRGSAYQEKMTPLNKAVRKDFITDKASSTEIVFGFEGPKNNDSKNKAIFDIVSLYLSQTNVGLTKELKNFNTYPDIGMEKVVTNPNGSTMLYYALSSSDDNSEPVLKLIYDKLSNIKKINDEELSTIKEKLLQSYKNSLEFSGTVNSFIGNAVLEDDIDFIENYENLINNISTDDVNNFIKKYFNLDKAALTLVHPNVSTETINANYENASRLSFKGRDNRVPLNTDKISELNLDNNYKIAFNETKNDNVYFTINRYNKPLDTNVDPIAKMILSKIYTMGTMNAKEDDFKANNEKNNISVHAGTLNNVLYVTGYSTADKFEQTLEKSLELLNKPRIKQEEFDKAISLIKDSISRSQDSANSIYLKYESQRNPLCISKKHILENIDNVKLEDVQKLHDYLIKNSSGIIIMNIPESKPEIKDIALKYYENFDKVKPYEYSLADVYKIDKEPVVLTKEKAVSQADILQVHNFKLEDTVKEKMVAEIANSILSSSQSIGLFNTLREKEHLAYSVHSSFDTLGNIGQISCSILTTTDNKEIGEISYDNVQKSIDGFNRQINELKKSNYTDDDFESAKRMLKAKLLKREGVVSKLRALEAGLERNQGLDYYNKLYEQIDTITREDIQNFVDKAFANPPIYSIVASKDTLEANKNYLDNLTKSSTNSL